MDYLKITDRFSPHSSALRQVFDKRFANPLDGRPERFTWDYWHVPDQYSLMRTPAEHYFPKTMFKKVVADLTSWGQENLGCLSISPPWLSYYVDGGEQRLHCDVPHGPWAFVLSLSRDHGKAYWGGETLIMRPEHLDFWRNFDSARGIEEDQLFDRVAPNFNRLIVFDPRLPHGVSRVNGTRDPRQSRLVLHGWFTHPQPILRGPIKRVEFQRQLEDILGALEVQLSPLAPMTGTLCYRLRITPRGDVQSVKILTRTIMSREGASSETQKIAQWLKGRLGDMRFSKADGDREVTLPLIFD